MRLILSPDVPIGGRCEQAHCPTVPGKVRRLPKRALPTSFAKCWYPHNCKPLQSTRLATRSFQPMASLSMGSPSTLMLFPRLRLGLGGALPTNPDVSLFFPKCLLFELDHRKPHPCPSPLSLLKGPSSFRLSLGILAPVALLISLQ